MNEILDLFPTRLHINQHANDSITEEICSLVEYIQNEYVPTIHYNSEQNININLFETHKDKLVHFLEWHRSVVNEYVSHDKWEYSESWLNIYPTGGSQPVHNHVANDCQISGCYYHNTTEEMGDLTFHHPNPYSDIDLWGCGDKTMWVKTYPSTTILFPSWLNHNTDNNADEQSKISIGFNIQVGRIQTGISGTWLGKDTVIHDRGYKTLDGRVYESS